MAERAGPWAADPWGRCSSFTPGGADELPLFLLLRAAALWNRESRSAVGLLLTDTPRVL